MDYTIYKHDNPFFTSLYCFVVIPKTELQRDMSVETLPDFMPPVTEETKSLKDYVTSYWDSDSQPNPMIRASAKQCACGRRTSTLPEEIDFWIGFAINRMGVNQADVHGFKAGKNLIPTYSEETP